MKKTFTGKFFRSKAFSFLSASLLLGPLAAKSQIVQEIITDYNGYWRSSISSKNLTLPNNSHHLLAFYSNGGFFSTGVNDAILTSNGVTYTPGNYWGLPVGAINGTYTSNTKVALGAMYDGVANGASTPPPANNIPLYLTDGTKGLDMGTGAANLPASTTTFVINNVSAPAVNDNVPDIIVTQIADPGTGAGDIYSFKDESGSTIGNPVTVRFTNSNALGNWVADFYEAENNPLTLLTNYTAGSRSICVWAADLSAFGITQANAAQIRNFNIQFNGSSDPAFVAYNFQAMSVQGALPVTYSFFKGSLQNKQVNLSWQTVSESNASHFTVEKSTDGVHYTAIGNVKAAGSSNEPRDYSYIDANPGGNNLFYRLRQYDLDGGFEFSEVVRIANAASDVSAALLIYPNPVLSGRTNIQHPESTGAEHLMIYNSAGALVKDLRTVKGSTRTALYLPELNAGTYQIIWRSSGKSLSSTIIVQ